jgi:hypothetical protein
LTWTLTLALAPALTLTWAWTHRPGIDIGVTEKYVQSEEGSASNRHLQSNSALNYSVVQANRREYFEANWRDVFDFSFALFRSKYFEEYWSEYFRFLICFLRKEHFEANLFEWNRIFLNSRKSLWFASIRFIANDGKLEILDILLQKCFVVHFTKMYLTCTVYPNFTQNMEHNSSI